MENNINSDSNRTVYPGQPRDEITQRVVYKHIFSILPFLSAIFIVSIVAIIGMYYLGTNEASFDKYINSSLVSLIGFLLLVLLVALLASVLWIWKRNKIVITNEHIVDIDQLGLFNRRVSTLRLQEIQDISARVTGPIQTMFKYGSIIIQTAGERENFVLDYMALPYELEQYILEARKNNYRRADDSGVKNAEVHIKKVL